MARAREALRKLPVSVLRESGCRQPVSNRRPLPAGLDIAVSKLRVFVARRVDCRSYTWLWISQRWLERVKLCGICRFRFLGCRVAGSRCQTEDLCQLDWTLRVAACLLVSRNMATSGTSRRYGHVVPGKCSDGVDCKAPESLKKQYCHPVHKCTRCNGSLHAMCGIKEPDEETWPTSGFSKCNVCMTCARHDGLVATAARDSPRRSPRNSPASSSSSSRSRLRVGDSDSELEDSGGKGPAKQRRKKPPTRLKPNKRKAGSSQRRKHQGSDDDEDYDPDLSDGDDSAASMPDLEYDKPFFNDLDFEEHPKGWFIPDDLDAGEDVGYRYQAPKLARGRVVKVGMLLQIPASVWGNANDWWQDSRYEEDLRKVPEEQLLTSVVIVGKVLGRPSRGMVDVALACNKKDDEVSQLRIKDVRRFVVVKGRKGSKRGPKPKASVLPKPVPGSDSEDLIEDTDPEESSSEEEEDDEEADSEGTATEEDEDDDVEPHDSENVYVVKDSNSNCFRTWRKVDEYRETSYSRPRTGSHVRNIASNEWESITATEIFKRNLPQGEMALWARLTSKALIDEGLQATTEDEMWRFVGCLGALTQSSKKGGVKKAFATESDGLFPALDLGRFGLKYWRWKELWRCWTFAELPEGMDESDMDPYWATDQLIERFNKHYTENFEHGFEITVDERIFWGYMLQHSMHKVDRKPRGTGQEYKCLSAVDVRVTSHLEQVRAIALLFCIEVLSFSNKYSLQYYPYH